MEKKVNKISFRVSGKGTTSASVSLPKQWLFKIGVTEDNREVELKFDLENKKITIEKI